MVGLEILFKLYPAKRAEFLLAFDMMKTVEQLEKNRTDLELFELVGESNTFLWLEYWDNGESLTHYCNENKYRALIGAMYSLPFKFSFDYGAENGEASFLNIQPVIPVTVGDWNLINRVIMPLIDTPGMVTRPLKFQPRYRGTVLRCITRGDLLTELVLICSVRL